MIDYRDIEPMLDGLWSGALLEYGIDVGDFKGLNTKNTSCPLCGGDDRAHWRETNGRISLYCRHCTDGTMKSPESVIMEATGISFTELVDNLASYVNHIPISQIKQVKLKTIAKPKINMPIDHRQDHTLVADFLKYCQWENSTELLCKNAPSPQDIPTKNSVDYFPMYNANGVMVNLVKYIDDYPVFIAGGVSYGSTYIIKGNSEVMVTISVVDAILCWHKTGRTVHVAFSIENLRYILRMNIIKNPIVCVRSNSECKEFNYDHSVSLLTGSAYGKRNTSEHFNIADFKVTI